MQMDSGKVIQLIQREQGMIINHHFDQPFLNCVDECRGIIDGIMELATEEEKFELLYSLVKYKNPELIKKIQEV
jgi:hypothetical protein